MLINYYNQTKRPLKTVNGNSLDGTGDIVISAGTIDAVPTDGSTNAVSSNGVFDALANKVDETNWIDISATSTIVGFSVFTIKDIKYKIVDTNLAIVRCDIQGTSNSTGISYTLPFTSANDVHNVTPAYITNNGLVSTTNGLAVCNANSSTIVVLRDNQGNPFTTSGTKRCSFTIIIRLWYTF